MGGREGGFATEAVRCVVAMQLDEINKQGASNHYKEGMRLMQPGPDQNLEARLPCQSLLDPALRMRLASCGMHHVDLQLWLQLCGFSRVASPV